MIAYPATISGANLILKRDPHGGSSRQGRVRTWTWPRRVPARSRVPA